MKSINDIQKEFFQKYNMICEGSVDESLYDKVYNKTRDTFYGMKNARNNMQNSFYRNNYHAYVVQKASNALKAIQYISNSVNGSTVENYGSIKENVKKWLTNIYRLATVCRNDQMMKLYQTMYYAVAGMEGTDDLSEELEYLKKKSQECWSALYAYYNDVVNGTEDDDRKYLDMFMEPGGIEDMRRRIENTPTDELSGVIDDMVGSEGGQTQNPDVEEQVDELDDELSRGGYEAVKIDFFGDNWFGLEDDFEQPYQRVN